MCLINSFAVQKLALQLKTTCFRASSSVINDCFRSCVFVQESFSPNSHQGDGVLQSLLGVRRIANSIRPGFYKAPYNKTCYAIFSVCVSLNLCGSLQLL